MKILERLKHLIAPVMALAAIVILFDYVHYIGTAHAQAADPQATVNAGGDAALDVWLKDGPIWGGLLVAMYGLRAFLSRQHWLAQGRALSAITGVSMIGAAVLNWHFGSAPFEGVLTAAFAAFALFEHSRIPEKPDGDSAAKGAVSMIAILLLGGLVAGQMAACSASAKQRAVNGATAALNCESQTLQPLVQELLPLATGYVLSVISADGKSVDTSALSKAWGGVKSDQGRCALATAIAVLATPQSKNPDAAMAAGLEPDPAALKAAFLEVRIQHGWGETQTLAGTL